MRRILHMGKDRITRPTGMESDDDTVLEVSFAPGKQVSTVREDARTGSRKVLLGQDPRAPNDLADWWKKKDE